MQNISDPHIQEVPARTTSETLDAERLANACKALAHPVRVRILQHLKEIDRCICGEIVNILPLAQSTVSQHLKNLKEAGFVQGEVEGPCTCYCIDHEFLNQFKEMAKLL
jgi:ArsR family transcriptional regulator, arsenate/arsenite/antimonite-responsive transcriptional repressor